MPPNTAASPSRSEGRVEEGAPVAGGVGDLGHQPVDHVGEHEERDDEHALPQPAQRKADQCADHHADGADDGDQIGETPA